MIELKVKEYCHNCPDFAAKVSVREHDDGNMVNPTKFYDTTVTCSHAKRCEGIMCLKISAILVNVQKNSL